MSICLVTGASGFIGKALQAELERKGKNIISMSSADGDISSKETWTNIAPAETVFHLAGKHFVPDSWKRPEEFMKVNLAGTELALDYTRQNNARMIFASAYLYGNPENLPISENAPIKPNNPYALSKHFSEQLCTFHRETYGTDVRVLRLFNVFGPGQKAEYLIPTIFRQIKNDDSITIENLHPRRDYTYIDDVISAMIGIAESDESEPVFNVGSGESLSVKDIIDIIQDVAGTNLDISSKDISRKNEIDDVRADISLIKKQTGWQPAISFKAGIEKILQQEK